MLQELKNNKQLFSMLPLNHKFFPTSKQHFDSDEMKIILKDSHVAIVGDDEIDKQVMQSAANLKAIVKWGVGLDSIDLNAAKSLGIPVRNTPAVFGNEVADWCFGYILMLARKQHEIDREVRLGNWMKVQGNTLSGKILGIIGYGDIGKHVASRAQSFGMKLVYFDPKVTQVNSIAVAVPLHELLAKSDFVVLAAPLTPDTHHIINEKALKIMKPTSYLINVARGQLVDEKALVEKLENHSLAGAALDVFEVEPLSKDNPLCRFSNVILGSHNASNTKEGVEKVSEMALRIALDHL